LLTSVALFLCPAVCKADDPNGLFFKPIPAKTVVLTFDDGPLSHYTNVAPLLKSLGLAGTFFWTEAWLGSTNYMNWAQVSNICAMGFEVGNHSKSHSQLIGDLGGGRGELSVLENDCLANGITRRPVAEDKERAALGILTQAFLRGRRQAVEVGAHVAGRSGDKDLEVRVAT
jgi:hypothetical protein